MTRPTGHTGDARNKYGERTGMTAEEFAQLRASTRSQSASGEEASEKCDTLFEACRDGQLEDVKEFLITSG